MYILGLNAYHPDSSACLIKDGKLLGAVEEERSCRIKHWAGFPVESIKYCLKQAGIGLQDLDYIALNRDPRYNLYKKIIFTFLNWPSFALVKNRLHNISKIRNVRDTLSRELEVPRKKIKAKIFNIVHHRAHLASTFLVSPFNRACVVSLDGFGDFTSAMVARGRENKIEVLAEINYPHSLGLFYTAFTQLLGFRKFGDEYKVMALAAYGRPHYSKEMEEILILKPKGRFILNLDYFSFYKSKGMMLWNNAEPQLAEVFSKKLIKKFGPSRKDNEGISTYYCDLACSLQETYERALFHVLNYAYQITGIANLCLAGGCALNSLANGRIFQNTHFKEIYIQPASSDSGGALGAAYYLYCHLLDQKREFVMDHAYWGPEFSDAEIYREIEKKGCTAERIESQTELCQKVAHFIAEGKIVGWFQGRMEWGPRALGNRSILADPRRKEMKDILNSRIKKREWFRPFAPAVLLEDSKGYFEKSDPEPFMLKAYKVKSSQQENIPAVINVDGTARLQTVSKEQNPLFWQLISEFKKITGVPLVLNTSFNEDEPIVCTPKEALNCFLRTKMDVLVMGNYCLEK